MLFNSLLKEIDQDLEPAFEKAFSIALKNQTHPSDLLLVMESAGLSDEPEDGDTSKGNKIYYTLGDGLPGHCQRTHHDFIGDYMKANILESHIEYDDFISSLKGNRENQDQVERQEATSIQVEMLIYLKIWEDELFLKQWYQLSLLLAGIDYDWDFKIGFNQKEEKNGILLRRTVHRDINKHLSDVLPVLHKHFSNSYNSQLRNAIAHSQYAVIGRDIYLTNHRKGKQGYELPGVSFEEWNRLFNTTVLIFTRFEMFFERVRDFYFKKSIETNMKREIRVSRRLPLYSSFLTVVYSRPIFRDWSPYPNP